MQQIQDLRSLQRELNELDVVNEIYLDADNDRISVRYRAGFDFRLEQALRDYPELEILANKEDGEESKAYIGLP